MFFERLATLLFFTLACFAVLMPTTVDSGLVSSPACMMACHTAYIACIGGTAGVATPACTLAYTICISACTTTVLIPA